MHQLEEKGFADQKSWCSHWDRQLYKALEHQYQLGIEALNQNLPEFKVELTYRCESMSLSLFSGSHFLLIIVSEKSSPLFSCTLYKSASAGRRIALTITCLHLSCLLTGWLLREHLNYAHVSFFLHTAFASHSKQQDGYVNSDLLVASDFVIKMLFSTVNTCFHHDNNRQQRLQFLPPMEEIRMKYYGQLKRFLAIPHHFKVVITVQLCHSMLCYCSFSLLQDSKRH